MIRRSYFWAGEYTNWGGKLGDSLDEPTFLGVISEFLENALIGLVVLKLDLWGFSPAVWPILSARKMRTLERPPAFYTRFGSVRPFRFPICSLISSISCRRVNCGWRPVEM